MRGSSSWKKYYPKQVWRYFKLAWALHKQRRYSEAQKILSIYRYPLFFVPVIGFVLLWVVWGPKRLPPTTTVTGDWATVRQAAVSRSVVTDFREAKKKLYPLYRQAGLTQTFYCGCSYTGKVPNLTSCGVVPRKNTKRMNRLEAEHVMPISLLGHTLNCWKKGGRKNCGKVDMFFQKAEADLHNLVPALGEINSDRSNYPPVENITGERREYGQCDVEISNKTFEPPAYRRGDIARAYLYMWKVYGAPLTNSEIRLFEQWHQQDSPTPDEKRVHELKAQIMRARNLYYDE